MQILAAVQREPRRSSAGKEVSNKSVGVLIRFEASRYVVQQTVVHD